VALLRLGELPAPPAALQEPAPVLIAAIAHTPALAPRRALEFAERAVQIGVLSAQELTARYLEQAPEARPHEPGLGAVEGDGVVEGEDHRRDAAQRPAEEPVDARA